MIGRLALVILAGGEGSRIGGGKPLRRLAGETLVERTLRIARGWPGELRVALRHADQLGPLDAPVLIDDPAVPGPLAGLAAALRFARERGKAAVLTVPCDMPFLPADLPGRLAGAIGDEAAALPASAGEIHPDCALWRAEVLDAFPVYLETGRRSLRGLAAAVGFVAVEWASEPVDPFFNVNDEADLRRAEEMVRKGTLRSR